MYILHDWYFTNTFSYKENYRLVRNILPRKRQFAQKLWFFFSNVFLLSPLFEFLIKGGVMHLCQNKKIIYCWQYLHLATEKYWLLSWNIFVVTFPQITEMKDCKGVGHWSDKVGGFRVEGVGKHPDNQPQQVDKGVVGVGIRCWVAGTGSVPAWTV